MVIFLNILCNLNSAENKSYTVCHRPNDDDHLIDQ